ncbi:DUF418 domain-containing protein [Ideonella sp. YS5]|uniref:DUF418 domain-containing protein n=1 Tax=Ideonella sp. YS5 TaxID=3453714 RepID=UPI003EEF82EA
MLNRAWVWASRMLDVLAPHGRMSLTCYVTQAVIGVPFFYAFGLDMYRYVGPFAALFFALAVFALQWAFAHAWLKRYSYGRWNGCGAPRRCARCSYPCDALCHSRHERDCPVAMAINNTSRNEQPTRVAATGKPKT